MWYVIEYKKFLSLQRKTQTGIGLEMHIIT